MPFMLENISYLDDPSSFRRGKKNAVLKLSQLADFILKVNSQLYCSTLRLSLQIQPRNTFVGHCFICSYTGTHRTEGTTYKFAQVPFPMAGRGSGILKLTKVLQLPVEVGSASHKRKVRSGNRGFSCLLLANNFFK